MIEADKVPYAAPMFPSFGIRIHRIIASIVQVKRIIIEEKIGFPPACSAAIRTADIHRRKADAESIGNISVLTEY